MADDLKSKLNARAELERQQKEDAEKVELKYKAAVLREYPRLVNELYTRVKGALDGVKDVKISMQTIKQTLTYSEGSTDTGIRQGAWGEVQVPQWTVSFLDRKIAFTPSGTGFIGLHGKIDMTMTRPNPLPHPGIFMFDAGDDPYTWKLGVVLDRNNPGAVELTDKLLGDLLEQALLQ